MRFTKSRTPYRVLNNNSDFRNYTSNVTYKEKPITWKKLNKVFDTTLENVFAEDSYVYLLSSDYNNIIPQLAAREVEKKVIEGNQCAYWYNVIHNHKMEDEKLKTFMEENYTPDVLIIDGVFTKTNVNNIDKLRELLSLFDSIPIYVVISGGFGPDFFSTQVFCPFNKFIHFGDTPRKKITTI